jgi:hypothetical protein
MVGSARITTRRLDGARATGAGFVLRGIRVGLDDIVDDVGLPKFDVVG